MDITVELLNGLTNLCLIVAVWRLSKSPCCFDRALITNKIFWQTFRHFEEECKKNIKKAITKADGERNGAVIRAAVAEKFAERAFNMASAANLGVVALQKSLATPRIMTPTQVTKNQLAKKEVDNLFTSNGGFDYLRPILSDEENDILDAIEEQKLKAAARANGTA